MSAQKEKAMRHYLNFGGYPALVKDDITDEERYQWLSDYSHTYLERDINDLANLRELEPFFTLQKLLTLQTGQLFNASALGVKTGVSTKTIQRYLQYLSLSYQVIILNAWERNTQRRLIKSPKIHIIDNGIARAILNRRGELNGNEFESAIISELYKQSKAMDAEAKFYHLRTQDGKEVDLIVETAEGYYAFEIKMATRVTATDARHLNSLEELLNDKPLLHCFVLSNDTETHHFTDKITALNSSYFLG